MHKTKYALQGTGYFVKLFIAQHPLCVRLKALGSTNVHALLCDPELFITLNITTLSGVLCNSFYDLKPTTTYAVYSTDVFTRLEIRNQKHTVTKLSLNTVIRTDYLFAPTHQIHYVPFNFKGLMVLEHDKGSFGYATLPHYFEPTFAFHFELLTLPQLPQPFVKTIRVNGQLLRFKKPNTLNYGMQVFCI
ncbi:MAG: hypothetical protein H7331_10990 [Bacteroidia bacterium]|nr:hypothetical protein [Bacteroidia bacterium]